MKWTELVPSEFQRLVDAGAVCVVPMGSLERHGEHIPFGCDLTVAETVAERAAAITPAVVFPGYYLAQVHEAACFTGTVNLPKALAVETLSRVMDGIAANGFRKIVILNAHGGNSHFLEYFAMSQLDEPREYALYVIGTRGAMTDGEREGFDGLWETSPLGHACELETSVYMACRPGLVRMDLVPAAPVLPLDRFAHLRPRGIHNAHWWYADYPENVVGDPAKASEEKGRKALDILAASTARALRIIQEDEAAPALQREFLDRVRDRRRR